uniref:Uncharacterized protein n=1 Tax=Oryza nivara TaxID=4536 RepID=A0A0E0GK99_ORYNI
MVGALVHGEVWVGGSPLFLSIPSHFGQSKIGDLDTAIDILLYNGTVSLSPSRKSKPKNPSR